MLCECDCGNRVSIPRAYLTRKGNPKKDCGKCGQEVKAIHTYNPEYAVWYQMIRRCYDPTHQGYENYGAQGIRVHQHWYSSFERFIADVGRRPDNNHSLDRIDPYKNYTPSNVRWATAETQARNKKNTKFVKHPRTRKRIKAADLADELNMTYQQLRKQLIDKGEW